ncbi:MAG: capsular exopolysaccharide family protein [Clostridiaceae bacterium]|jgi:capsular exopolysaccharide synthesis family protein|nr:capsular exopolysaccharide family protein [Clostridiaceae bacterium]
MIKGSIITIDDPNSPAAEKYKMLRTNLQFYSIDSILQTIMITSAGPGEGKSTVSANLASVMAQSGKKTLLIDCDFRKPMEHKLFGLSNMGGLSNVLVEEINIYRAIQQSKLENLFILTSGVRPPNPSELLASDKMNNLIISLRKTFDYIIFDTPPVAVVTDAQLMSRMADGCVLVISSGETGKEEAVKAKELLQKVNAKIIGVVLNKVKVTLKNKDAYYKYYYNTQGPKKK